MGSSNLIFLELHQKVLQKMISLEINQSLFHHHYFEINSSFVVHFSFLEERVEELLEKLV